MKKNLMGLVLATTVAASSAWAAGPQDRMVIQVSDGDPKKWNLALNNARNAFNDLGKDNVQIEIVAYGPGIGMLKMEAVTAGRVEEAIKSGISIFACENTMTAQKIRQRRHERFHQLRFCRCCPIDASLARRLGLYSSLSPFLKNHEKKSMRGDV